MPADINIPRSTATNVAVLAEYRPTEGPKETTYLGGGGGQPPVDTETKNYLDAKVDAVKANNDARFADVRSGLDSVLSQISILSGKIDEKPSIVWIIGVAVAGFLAVVAVLAFGGDRFDGGVQVQSTVSERTEALNRLAEENARQISEIIRLLEDEDTSNSP